jgi:glyoxylase I family protein
MATPAKLPSRLHHTAYVTRDLEATRKFYEELIGLPLVATWCEKDELFGAERVYCHLFFALADGGALAFFKFAKKEDEELFGPRMPDSPFHHIALNVDQETRMYVLEHGYCRSVYVTDPNGLILEFTLDHPKVKEINATRRANAHAELKRWMAGDHTSNNTYR